ncbi:hypothetical protein ACWGKU_04815 [Kitasatospora sp. NPDC054768]
MQHEVLRLMASGASNAQIGQHLRKGRDTTAGKDKERGAYLVRGVFACLGASRRAHAVDIACRLGLVDMPQEVRPPEQGIPPYLRTSAVLLASGLSCRQAAQQQGRSPFTVRSDRHLLYDRVGASGGAHAVHLLHALQELPASHPCACLKPPGAEQPGGSSGAPGRSGRGR